jgi:hypothetical protein
MNFQIHTWFTLTMFCYNLFACALLPKKNIKPTAIQCFCIFWNLWYYFIFPKYCCSRIPCVVSNISCFINVHVQFQHQHTFMVCPSSLLLLDHFQLPIGPLKVITSLSLPFMSKLHNMQHQVRKRYIGLFWIVIS